MNYILTLQKCESNVCQLIGEVEILRARKTVLIKYAHEQLLPANADTLLVQNRYAVVLTTTCMVPDTHILNPDHISSQEIGERAR